jgi:hypothetical protein
VPQYDHERETHENDRYELGHFLIVLDEQQLNIAAQYTKHKRGQDAAPD